MKSDSAATATSVNSAKPARSAKGGKITYASTKKIQTVMENLEHRIKNGEWKAEEYLPPQSQLAREYGVSQAAITIAMRTVQKKGLLQVIPKKGAFVPKQCTGGDQAVLPIIGIRGSYLTMDAVSQVNTPCDPKTTYSYNASTLQAVWMAAQQEECSLLLLPTSKEARLTPQSCLALGIQGALFLGGETYEEAMKLRLSGFPIMTANPPCGWTPINFVEHDNGACLVDALLQFISLGHKRIAVLFPCTSTPGSYEQHKSRFMETLCAARLVYNFEDYWRLAPHPSLRQDIDPIRVMNELFDLPEPPTAIFCFAGSLVLAIRQVLHERGLSVPLHVSLLYAPFDPTLQPAASGYAPQFNMMAKTLLHGLLETIRNPFYSIQELIPFHKMVDHGTLAPPPR